MQASLFKMEATQTDSSRAVPQPVGEEHEVFVRRCSGKVTDTGRAEEGVAWNWLYLAVDDLKVGLPSPSLGWDGRQ